MERDEERDGAPVKSVAIEPSRASEHRRAGPEPERDTAARVIGRYVLFREVAHGGMATVHLGRLRGAGGFARTVAIKRLLPPFARDPEFVSMFLDEARLAARVQHPNVVSVLDVVASEGELFLVMEYVHGEGLSKLLKRARTLGLPVPPAVVVHVLIDVLYGLHAAHEARNERGDPLNIVHRDVSPQNVIVGIDGVARVLDFGIAKAAQCAHSPTGVGQLKGKLGYMAPEQVAAGVVDRRADVYAAGVTLWEALTGERMFAPAEIPKLMAEILTREHVPPSRFAPATSPELDAVVLCALERDPKHRYATAGSMAADLERVVRLPSRREIGAWVSQVADGALRSRAASLAEIETTPFAEVAVRPPARTEAEPTVSTLAERAPRRERRVPWRWIAGPALLTAAAALGVVGRRAPDATPAHDPPARAAATTSSPAPVAAASVLEDPRADPAAPPVEATASAAVAHADAPPQADTAPADAAAPSAHPWWWGMPPTKPQAGARAQGSCTPPYTTDANGVRIPKRWCP